MGEKYYLQNNESGYLGNSLMWWREGDCGYTADLNNAKVWTQDEAIKEVQSSGGKFTMWKKSYIDQRTQIHVDMQYINHNEQL